MSSHERLGALDAAFLTLDRAGTPFHVGAVLIFDRAPLANAAGALDRTRLEDHLGGVIDALPRYHQRVARVPGLGHPVWVDDPHFALERHVDMCAVPRGGLERCVGELLSRDLRADAPPWHLTIVDDPAAERFALVVRLHHCLVDGVAGIRLLERAVSPSPDAPPAPHTPWSPAAPPSKARLLAEELAHRARGLARLGLPDGDDAWALAALLARALRSAPDVSINPRRVTRQRVFATAELDLDALKEVRRAAGVPLNDVILAVAAGALRAFLLERGLDEEGLVGFRTMVPVSTHPPGDRATSGSQVALILVDLPVDEPDPRRRLERVHAATRELKERSRQVAAGELLVGLSDVTSSHLLSGALRLALARRAFNLVLTNIPGPPVPLYLLGCRLQRLVPIVNLWPRQSIGIAVASYHGRLTWGIQADRDDVPDLDGLVQQIPRAFRQLRDHLGSTGAEVIPLRAPATF